jgi:hypothetical protein
MMIVLSVDSWKIESAGKKYRQIILMERDSAGNLEEIFKVLIENSSPNGSRTLDKTVCDKLWMVSPNVTTAPAERKIADSPQRCYNARRAL